jgi:hypothetical protein
MANTRELPPAMFDLVPALFPELTLLFVKCDASPAVIYALTYVKHYGKQTENGHRVILRSELADALEKMLHDKKSDSAMSDFITDLVNRELLSKTALTSDQKHTLYGDSHGRKDALILTEPGSAKIDEFKAAVNALFESLVAGDSSKEAKRAIDSFVGKLGPVSGFLIRSLQKRQHSEPPMKRLLRKITSRRPSV